MLVLSRKEGQRIQIGEDTWVIVGKIKGNRVCLGIEAPNAVAIRRTELVPPIDLTPPTTTPERTEEIRVA